MYSCQTCEFKTSSLRAYAHHYIFHRNANNVQFPCPVECCVELFSSYKTFVRHISSQHTGTNRSVNRYLHVRTDGILHCHEPLCNETIHDLSELFKHLRKHIDSGLLFLWGYKFTYCFH